MAAFANAIPGGSAGAPSFVTRRNSALSQVKFMPPARITRPSLNRSFRIALLLTGNVAWAEEAMLEAIDTLDAREISEDALLRGTIAAAVMSERGPEGPELGLASSILPPELMRLLGLPTPLRDCFVLRMIAALSRADCAQMLGLSTAAVDERTCEAARELAAGEM
jgi:hypothetical protein